MARDVGLAPVLLVVALASCAETRRSLGEECLKNDDCLSGLCVARACDHPSDTLERPLPATPAPTSTTPVDAAADVRGDAPGGGG